MIDPESGAFPEERAGRGLSTPSRRFHLFTNVLAGQNLELRTVRPGFQKPSGPFLPGSRDGGLAPVRHPKAFLPPVLRWTGRLGAPALVVALLKVKSLGFPNSVCGNLVFEESLIEEKPISSPFRVCDHLFVSPAPGTPPLFRTPQFQMDRFSGGHRKAVNRFGSHGGPAGRGEQCCVGETVL